MLNELPNAIFRTKQNVQRFYTFLYCCSVEKLFFLVGFFGRSAHRDRVCATERRNKRKTIEMILECVSLCSDDVFSPSTRFKFRSVLFSFFPSFSLSRSTAMVYCGIDGRFIFLPNDNVDLIKQFFMCFSQTASRSFLLRSPTPQSTCIQTSLIHNLS